MLDIDALNKAEGENWVYKGCTALDLGPCHTHHTPTIVAHVARMDLIGRSGKISVGVAMDSCSVYRFTCESVVWPGHDPLEFALPCCSRAVLL